MEKLVELNSDELLNIQGGDKWLRNLGLACGDIIGNLANMLDTVSAGMQNSNMNAFKH